MVASFVAESAMQHSVNLFPAIEEVLSRAQMKVCDCDFIACVVGPGSFTGIRIGISAVKGLAMGTGRAVLPVTSFDEIAYAEESETKIALVDAGHGYVYAQGYGGAHLEAGYYPAGEVAAAAERCGAKLLSGETIAGLETCVVDAAAGLSAAASAKRTETVPHSALAAVYLRRSSAEERR